MTLPSIWGENLFDEIMDFPFEDSFFGRRNPLYGKTPKNLMKTDVQENDDAYNLTIDLPGFAKENIVADLKNGYLIIQATKNENKDEKDKDGRYIRRERHTGSCSRSFYVGSSITKEDINAKFEDGILKVVVPKKKQEAVEQSSRILIEG